MSIHNMWEYGRNGAKAGVVAAVALTGLAVIGTVFFHGLAALTAAYAVRALGAFISSVCYDMVAGAIIGGSIGLVTAEKKDKKEPPAPQVITVKSAPNPPQPATTVVVQQPQPQQPPYQSPQQAAPQGTGTQWRDRVTAQSQYTTMPPIITH